MIISLYDKETSPHIIYYLMSIWDGRLNYNIKQERNLIGKHNPETGTGQLLITSRYIGVRYVDDESESRF